MADEQKRVPVRDSATGKIIGHAEVVDQDGGRVEISGVINDRHSALSQLAQIRAGLRAQSVLEEVGEADPVEFHQRDPAADARGPAREAVRQAEADRRLPGWWAQSFTDPLAGALQKAAAAAAAEESRVENALVMALLGFRSHDHRRAILDSLQERARLFERMWAEADRPTVEVRSHRCKAMLSVLDDIQSGRL